MATKNHFQDRVADEWARTHGIVHYKHKYPILVYIISYPETPLTPRKTVEIRVDLNTGQVVSEYALNKYDPAGEANFSSRQAFLNGMRR